MKNSIFLLLIMTAMVSWGNRGIAQTFLHLPTIAVAQPQKTSAEASDGDGEVPDEIESPEAASPQPESGKSSQPEVQSNRPGFANQSKASKREVSDAVENR
jgi:hypothetical protein